jgi:hypothetical protein
VFEEVKVLIQSTKSGKIKAALFSLCAGKAQVKDTILSLTVLDLRETI